MELGFKKLDEKQQKQAKSGFRGHVRARRFEWVFLVVLFAVSVIGTIVFGVWTIFEPEKVRLFKAFGMITIVWLIVFGIGEAIGWFIEWVMRRMTDGEKLPAACKRSLKDTLNYMNGNVGGLLWDILWGCLLFSGLVAWAVTTADGKAKTPLNMENFLNAMPRFFILLGIVLAGHFLLEMIHKRRNRIPKMLKNTKTYYNYGNEEMFVKYVDWSLQENMLFRTKQLVLTKEIILGYGHTDTVFYPIAISREFIKEAEYREVLWSNSKVSACTGVLACKLHNGKVVDFYLSRGVGNQRVCNLLIKYEFPFSIRKDAVEYQ